MPASSEIHPARATARPIADALEIELSGRWSLTEPYPSLASVIGEATPTRLVLRPAELEAWDSSLLLFVAAASRWAREHKCSVDLSAFPPTVRQLAEQMATPPVSSVAQVNPLGFLRRIGLASYRGLHASHDVTRFVGQATLGAWNAIRAPRRFRWHDCFFQMQQCGAMALPITSLISFLVGVTLAYTGAIILRQYGGDIYVADLVGLSMVREMGAMMTAVVLAGRTGAAFAAEIGNMKAGEEVDALVTLGLSPIDFLVMPRIVALCVMMPLLALYADCLGIAGGMVVAQGVLHIPPPAYWVEMGTIVNLTDIWAGLIKATAFGLIVGLCGCLRGLQADRSAAGVGRAATSAVVSAILVIIVADSLFAVVFNILGI